MGDASDCARYVISAKDLSSGDFRDAHVGAAT
jgi:hypothetical protein